MSAPATPLPRPRLLLALASVAVAIAAADTYVVVLALPEMMGSVGLPIDQLQRAAPIVSGFLLGYVAMLPLIGRVADLRGRVPVLLAALVVFAAGSLVTALAYDLPSLVTGRFVQGVGGGGLVPATLALVADLYPPHRRGLPLGLVSAVQELGSVLGPLFGAAVLALADWRWIFGLNLAAGLVLAGALRVSAPGGRDRPGSRWDWPGAVLAILAVLIAAVVLLRPPSLVTDLTWGRLFIPYVGDGRWLTPIGIAAMVAFAAFWVRQATARRPLVDVRGWAGSAREADLTGATLLAVALAGVILAFASADPAVQTLSAQSGWYLVGAVVAGVLLVLHLRRAEAPLLPRGTLRARPAWGAVVVSLFIGAALIAALIDVPIFARTTTYRDSQLLAALVLVRFLVALPVGAVAGGLLLRRLSPGPLTAVGMVLAAVGFAAMTRWDVDSLHAASASVPLVIGGLGFGLALAPVNAAVLAGTDAAAHGVASAFVVVARMVGMLVGISVLTTVGLRRFYAAQDALPSVRDTCGRAGMCDAYQDLQRAAGITQEHTVFTGAMICALIAAVLALALLRGAEQPAETAPLPSPHA